MKVPIKRLIDRCWDIAESVADRSGFVPIRNLAASCNCQIVPRPLLVEAAITRTLKNPNGWVVLINNETHKFSDEDLELESALSHLPVRTRNTLAHEVAHAVACDLFGMDFSNGGTLDSRLASIERAIELVSPLLLLPKSHVLSRLAGIPDEAQSLREFSTLARNMGVSREVFLQAVKTKSKYSRSEFLTCESILGAMWGVFEARGKNSFETSSRWLFNNYHTVLSHPSSKRIQQQRSIRWNITSIEQKNGRVFCSATSDLSPDRSVPVQFEIESPLQRSGQKLFYKLTGAESPILSSFGSPASTNLSS
jgi:hypothetical protein